MAKMKSLARTGIERVNALAIEVAWTLRDLPRRAYTLAEIREQAARWPGCKRLAHGVSDDDVRKLLDALCGKGSARWLRREGDGYVWALG